MNTLTKMAVVSAAAVLVAQGARAQIANGDLVLGFTGTGATTQDYVIDLGSLTSFNSQSSTIQHLGGLVNLGSFAVPNPVIGSMNVGVLFGSGNGVTGDYVGYGILRSGNNAAGTVGTEAAPATPSGGSFVTLAANAGNGTTLGTPANTTALSFTGNANPLTTGGVAQNLNAQDVLNPMAGTSIALDLFESTRLAPSGRSTPASAFTYEGTLNIDLSGANAVVDFTPAGFASAVPEPSTYGLIGGAGLLFMALRRQLRGSVV